MGACLLVALLASSHAHAQAPDTSLWGVENAVAAIARSGDKLYVGGAFLGVFPNTGGGVVVDRRSGAKRRENPRVAGWVNTAIPDGSGGWFIGGAISGVGGLPRSGVARIDGAARVSDWDPWCEGQVFALARKGDVVYVAGDFTRVGSLARHHLAAIDANTGVVRDWAPSPSGPVYSLLVRGDTIFVGGQFDSIGGVPRMSLAAYDLGSGALIAWDPSVIIAGGPGRVQAMAARGDTLYLGGTFGTLGGQPRPYLGAVSIRTGAVTEWRSNIATTGLQYDSPAYVASLAAGDHSIYVAGHFISIGGVPRQGLAELDATTGSVTAWDPQAGPVYSFVSPFMNAIAVAESTVYVAGNKEMMGGDERYYVAELSRATGRATDWDPRANSIALTLGVTPEEVFVGGHFWSIGNEWQRRRNLAVFNARTGMLDDWGPIDNNGSATYGVVVDRGIVYVGGGFTEIGGLTRWGLAAIDSATGRILDWNPGLDQPISRMYKRGDRLFICGNFTQVAGQARSRIASFDLRTGALEPWHPTPDAQVEDLAFGDGVVYAVGIFQHAGGLPRVSAAAFDADSGGTLPWDAHVDQYLNAVAVKDSTVFLGGPIQTASGVPRIGFAAVDARTGDVRPWAADVWINPTRRGRVYALATMGDTLFIGGGFATVAGQPRSGLAALNATTGELLDWDPQPRDATADFPFTVSVLFNLTVHERTLYIGGRFAQVGPHAATSLAAFDFAPAPPPPPPPAPPPSSLALRAISPNPARGDATITLAIPRPVVADLEIFDLQGRRVAQPLRRSPVAAGETRVGVDTSGWREGVYFCRLAGGGEVAIRRFTVLR